MYDITMSKQALNIYVECSLIFILLFLNPSQNSLNTSDFAELSAPLLYDMFKAHSEYPLHLAIQHLREDVVFLFLIEHNGQVGADLFWNWNGTL